MKTSDDSAPVTPADDSAPVKTADDSAPVKTADDSAPVKTAADSAPPERSLRRDAERNRRRIMDSARVVFADRGLRGSYDDIAREAGVGVGTVYRRFPDRQRLIDVLFEEALDEIVAIAEAGLAVEDPWDGFVQFMLGSQERQCADRGLREIVLNPDDGDGRLARARSQIVPAVDRLIARAQAAGVLRADIQTTDIGVVQLAVCTIADLTRDSAPGAWRRAQAILLDGLQPVRDTVHPMTVPALTLDQFDAAMQAGATGRR